MGGNINWVLILENGTEYRMKRWTNSLKWATTNLDFLAGKPEAIQEALQPWLDMKEDWKKNKDTGNYEFNMTSVYAPYPSPLTGSEYGIVVTDFRKKKIMSCNHYTDFRTMSFHYYKDDHEYSAESEDYIEAKAEYDAGRILAIRVWDEVIKRPRAHYYDGSQSFQDFINMDDGRYKMLERILPFGWDIIDLEWNVKERRQAALDMVKNDFRLELSDFEESALRQWVER